MGWIDITSQLVAMPGTDLSCPAQNAARPLYSWNGAYFEASPYAFAPGDPEWGGCFPGAEDTEPEGYANRGLTPDLLYIGSIITGVTKYRLTLQLPILASAVELDGAAGWFTYGITAGNGCFGCGSINVSTTMTQVVEVEFAPLGDQIGEGNLQGSYGAFIQFGHIDFFDSYFVVASILKVEVFSETMSDAFWTDFVKCEERSDG